MQFPVLVNLGFVRLAGVCELRFSCNSKFVSCMILKCVVTLVVTLGTPLSWIRMFSCKFQLLKLLGFCNFSCNLVRFFLRASSRTLGFVVINSG